MKNIKIATTALTCALALVVFAEDKPTASAAGNEVDPDAAAIAAEGGLVTEPYVGKCIMIVNNQKRIPSKDFFAKDKGIEDLFGYPVRIVAQGSDLKEAGLVITVSDNETAPSILIAPEAPWAGVNIHAIATDNPKPDVLRARLQKEIWRAFMFVCGAANSSMQPCIMRPILRAKDLDDHPVCQPCPEPINKVMQMANHLGIHEKNVTTYRDACEQGWAPAPTNDVQKKIWEQYKKPETRWQKDFGGKKGDGKSK